MKNKVSKNLLMIVLLTIFVVAILGISFAYTTYESVSTDNYVSFNHISESGTAIVFSANRVDASSSVSAGFKLNVKVTETFDTINASQLKAKVEYGTSSDNINQLLGITPLSVGSDVQIANVSSVTGTGYYRVTFYDGDTLLNIDERNFNYVMTASDTIDFNFVYTDTSQEFTAPFNGTYYVELWGAAGNYYPEEMKDQVGKGAYTAGKLNLSAGDKLYIYTGQNAIESGSFYGPSFNAGSSAAGASNNSGAQLVSCGKNENCHNSSSGGGATDVRLVPGAWDNADSLNSRIMVAAGGGGTQKFSNSTTFVEGIGGSGGGLVGYYAGLTGNWFGTGLEYLTIVESDGISTTLGSSRGESPTCYEIPHDFTFGGRQKDGGLTNPGTNTRGQPGTFGKGGNGHLPDPSQTNPVLAGGAGGGGGGGYYGGAGGGLNQLYTNQYNRTTQPCHSPGAGGSSFIAGHQGSISIQNASNPNCTESGYRPENYVNNSPVSCSYVTANAKDIFTDTVMIDGEGYVWTNVRTSTRTSMPTPPTGGGFNAELAPNGYGNIGSGAARITYLSNATGGTISTWTKSVSSTYTVTVHHYKQGTTNAVPGCTDPAPVTKNAGDSWTTTACTPEDGYELLETPSNATGTSISGDVEVIYYYFLPKYKLTVQHLALEKNAQGNFIPTENKVFEPDTVTENIDAGTNYNVSNDYKSSNELKAPYTGKYEHDSNMDTDTEGVITDDTVAKLYYKPKSSQVIVRYYLQGTTVHANTEDVDYTYNTNVNYLDTFNIQPSTHKIAGVSNTPNVTIPNNYNFDSVTVTGATNTTTTTSTVTGTINDDTVTVTYYYTRSASLRVQHFAMARNEANIFAKTETKVYEPDSVDTTVTDGASYDVRDQYKDSNSLKTPYTGKYEHDQSQDSYLTGNIDGDTVVKFYYKPKASRVTVKFLEKNSTTFANSEQIDYVYGDQTDIGNVYINDTFDITPDIHLVAGVSNNPTVTLRNVYVFDSIVVTGASNVTKNGTNVKGTIDGTDVTIIYYYTKQVARLDVYHYKMTRTSNGTYVKTTEQAPGTTNIVGQSIEAFSNQNIGASTTVSGNWNFEVVDYTDPNGNTTSSDSEPFELIGVEPNKTYKFVFYYIESYATVESRYIDCSIDTPIASSVVEYFRFGDPYNGTQKTFTGYNYKGVRYELSDSPDRGDPAAGTISKPEYRVDYCYKKQYKIDVRYIDGDTNEELDSELYNKEDGEQYTTVEKTFTNYSLLGVDGTYEGFINATNVDANGVLHVVYKYRKSFTLTVKYIEDKSPYTNKLHEDLVETYKRTENYTATEYAVDGYHKSRVEGNLNGTIEGDTTVIIYYTPNDYDIIVNYVDCDSKQSIGVQPTRVTRQYLSSYTSNKIDIDNYSYGNVESNIEGAVLDQTAGTATVIVPIVDNSNPATITYCYNRKTSTLIVHHYDCSNNNNSLMNDEVQNGVKWGEDYTTTDHTIPNYIYTSDSGNTSGTVDATTVNSNNQIVVTYCYSRQNGSLTVKYLEEGSDAVVKAPHQESIDYGESYDARPYKENIPYYEFVRVSGNETGTISGNVTVTYYYRRLIGKLTIYYKDAVTHDTIATTKEMNWTLGEDYSSIPYIISIDNYTYSQTHDGPETGVMGDPTANVEVTYYYNKNTVQLIVRYLDIENDRKLCDDVTQDKTYGDKYITTQKEFDYYHFVRTDKPTTGYIYNQLVITYYYRRNTGIVRTYYRDVDDQREIANREDQVVPYESTYTTIEKSISKYDKVRIDGNPSDTLLSDEVEVTYYYQKKKGKVITQHFDRTNNTQFGQDIVDEYKLDEHYETHSIEIPNYELVATPDAYVGTVTSTTPIYVKYYYDQLKGVVIIRYLDEDTKEELQQTQRIGYNYGQHYTVTAPTIDNYTLSRVAGNESGEVGEEQIIVTYYYKINVGKLTVEHLEQGTNRNLKEPTVTDYPYGTNYLTHREVFENYEFVNFTGSERGIINGNIVVRYFYRLKDATITVNYVEEGNPANHVKDTEVYNVKWGDDYLFNSVRIENFDYIRSDGDPDRGTVAGNIVINYYYKRKPANLVVHHLETGTERILANEDRETVYYGLPYNTSSKDIEGYKKDASHSPTNDHGIVNGDIEVTYYYDRKDADVVITYVDRADITNPFLQITDGYNYGDTYTTEQREFAGYEYVDHDGALTGKVTKDHTYVTYYYERQVGNITVKYLDEIDLHELYQTSSTPMNYGEQYTTDEREFAGYELSRIDGRASGTVDGDKIIIYYYKKKAATVTVNYIDFVTQEELHSPTIINYKYGDSYQTDKLNIKDYDYLMVDGIESGTVDDDNIVVTYYYERHQAIVVSHYVEEGTNNVLAEPQTHEVGLGKYYSTNLPGSIPADYELVRKTDNYEGIARQDRIDVYYYYRKANSDLTTKITKVGNSEITDLENNVDYEIIYEANVNNYRGSATLTIIDKLPYKIDLSLSNLDGGVYNPYKNTIEWNIVFEDNDEDYEHESLDTYLDPKLDTIQVSKYVSLKYIGIDPTERNMINTVTGKLKLSNNTQEISNNLSTKISIPGTIIVHHYNIETGEELIPEEYNEGLVGETFISHPHDFEGYKVVTRPSNETLVFNEGEQEVIYEYERIKFNVQVSVVGGIGEATGNEEIFYGDDSTEGYIVITPGEGYEIEKIVVNGVSYDIYDREGMTLENFINVQENIDIEVEFSEVAIPVPITGKTSKYIIIASIMIILSIMYVAYNKGLITKLLKR